MKSSPPIYTRDLVQGRWVKSYKVHQFKAVPEEEWVRVPDTHEAIITHETFDKVQALLVRDTRISPKRREVHLFSGFLKCADCGKSITRSQSGKNIYYACSTYKNRSRTACSMHSIKHNRLEAAVLFAIQYQVNTAELADMLARLNAERTDLANGVDKEHPALVAFAKYQSIETLTREIPTDLVDHIRVYENDNISVHFKFADEFRKIAEYIEINITNTAEAG